MVHTLPQMYVIMRAIPSLYNNDMILRDSMLSTLKKDVMWDQYGFFCSVLPSVLSNATMKHSTQSITVKPEKHKDQIRHFYLIKAKNAIASGSPISRMMLQWVREMNYLICDDGKSLFAWNWCHQSVIQYHSRKIWDTTKV